MCMATYGLALNSDGLGSGSGIHLYFALQCLMDIPACIITLVLADRTGRKRLMIVSMLIGGLACIGTIFTTLYGGKGNSSSVTLGDNSNFCIHYLYKRLLNYLLD